MKIKDFLRGCAFVLGVICAPATFAIIGFGGVALSLASFAVALLGVFVLPVACLAFAFNE